MWKNRAASNETTWLDHVVECFVFRAQKLTRASEVLSQTVCVYMLNCAHCMEQFARELCPVDTPPSVTVDLIDCKRNPTATFFQKKKSEIRF